MKTLLSLAVCAALSVSAAAQAGALVDVTVVDRDTGATLPAYAHDGKFYIAGTPGHRYGVRLTNRTGMRVLAVLSVDGVNAISGETASPDQSGYVLDGYQSTHVDGWRKSMSEIAQFNFTNLGNSYAARTGRPDNVGVIGVAVFREKPLFWREGRIAEAPLGDRYPPAPAAGMPAPKDAGAERAKPESAPAMAQAMRPVPASQPEESLGTGHGARERSEVRYTQFVRASASPDEVDSIWYDSRRNLVARGVIPAPRPIAREPQPFPNGFVPDPAG
ncbi:MAG: hypothetical protein JSS28_08450 [Proteobacteria bacterium]|nr:hypothetical protein [Pseudomonadota bacterium]